MKKEMNKGFSLVELIIVIAIMAILIGVLAPAYIKYVEKSRISSDLNLVDSISKALTYAATDNTVLEDSATDGILDSMKDASNPMKLEDLMNYSTSLYTKEFLDTMCWTDCNRNSYLSYLKSGYGSGAEIYVVYRQTLHEPFYVWVSYTDRTGKRNYQQANTLATVGDCIAVAKQ